MSRESFLVPAGSHLQHGERENFVQCEERVCSVRTTTYAVGGEGVWLEKKSAVSEMSHLQYKKKKCSVRRLSDLQYEEKVDYCEDKAVQCEERVISTRRLHSQQEDRVCSLRRKSAVSAM